MCLSDWRIGRWIRTAQRVDVVGIAGTVVYPANNDRVGLVICAPPTGTIITANAQIQFNGFTMGVLAPNALRQEFWFPQYGDILRQSFSITAASNAFSVSVTEFILSEAIIAQVLEEFITKDY